MYKVIKFFTDLQDNKHPYNVGDVFPREGVKVNQNRFSELSGSNNRRRQPLIKYISDTPENLDANEGVQSRRTPRKRKKD